MEANHLEYKSCTAHFQELELLFSPPEEEAYCDQDTPFFQNKEVILAQTDTEVVVLNKLLGFQQLEAQESAQVLAELRTIS